MTGEVFRLMARSARPKPWCEGGGVRLRGTSDLSSKHNIVSLGLLDNIVAHRKTDNWPSARGHFANPCKEPARCKLADGSPSEGQNWSEIPSLNELAKQVPLGTAAVN
jgi:hypothetical protein